MTTAEQWVRGVGLCLQVTGLVVTAYGIADTRRKFTHRPGAWAAYLEWWGGAKHVAANKARALVRRVTPWRHRDATVHPGIVVSTAVTGTATARSQVEYGDTSTLVPEAVLAELIRRSQELRKDLNTLENQLYDEQQQRARELAEERFSREAEDARLDETIEDLAGGGLRLETVGLALLIVGVIMATMPDALVSLWDRVF